MSQGNCLQVGGGVGRLVTRFELISPRKGRLVLVAKQISVAGSSHSAGKYYPPDHARNMPCDSGEAAAARLVQLVPTIEQPGLYHGFAEILGLNGGDCSIEFAQRRPSLVRCSAGALGGPFLVDDSADEAGDRIADRLSFGLRQSSWYRSRARPRTIRSLRYPRPC